MAKSIETEPAVFFPEVAKQHDVFAAAIALFFGVLVSAMYNAVQQKFNSRRRASELFNNFKIRSDIV